MRLTSGQDLGARALVVAASAAGFVIMSSATSWAHGGQLRDPFTPLAGSATTTAVAGATSTQATATAATFGTAAGRNHTTRSQTRPRVQGALPYTGRRDVVPWFILGSTLVLSGAALVFVSNRFGGTDLPAMASFAPTHVVRGGRHSTNARRRRVDVAPEPPNVTGSRVVSPWVGVGCVVVLSGGTALVLGRRLARA